MRLARAGSGVAFAFVAGVAQAADPVGPGFAPPLQPMSLVSELRIGGSAQDPWSRERGSGNLAGEVLLRKPITAANLFTSYFVPRPHLGSSLNFAGRTSFAYAGLTWSADITPALFFETSLGGAIHNGSTGDFTPPDRNALGCSPLFREAASLGVRLSERWSVVATVERLTNGGLCDQNRGLTNVGARVGYTF
jgi:lipid A 3-O-deacylase